MSMGKPTPLTECIRPMPLAAIPSSAASIEARAAPRETLPVTKSVTRKKASWVMSPLARSKPHKPWSLGGSRPSSFELSTAACPSYLTMNTGRFGAARSRSALDRRRRSVTRWAEVPKPSTTASRRAAQKSEILASASSMLPASRTSSPPENRACDRK
jgi:hypothetical protein